MSLTPATVKRETIPGDKPGGRFYLGDIQALADELLSLYAGKVKLIYLDPPFMTGDKFNMRVRARLTDWTIGDPSLTLPTYADDLTLPEYLELMRCVFKLSHELLSEQGMLFLHTDYRMNSRLRLMLDEVFGEEHLLNEIIWVYRTGGRAKRYFSRKHETILFYRKSNRYDFNIEAVMEPRREPRLNHMRRNIDPDGRMYSSIRSGGREYAYYDDDLVAPSDVWADISHLNQRDPQRTGYDTQKPLALLDRIVRCASYPGDIVFDPFAGSCTTLEAARLLEREFIGADKCALSMNILRRRLEGADLTIFPGEQPPAPKCEATYYPGVGYYHVTLDELDIEPELKLKDRDHIESWGAGYLDGDTFLCKANAVRSRKLVMLPESLELPMYEGVPAIRVCDVYGRCYYYELGKLTMR